MNSSEPGHARAEQDVTASPVFARIIGEIGGNPLRRQEILRELRRQTGRYTITYIALITSPGASIGPDDVAPFTSVLASVPPNEPIDLMINSPGGLPDTAEKLIELIRQRGHPLRAVVPNFAKSAATLMCLGADSVVMSDTSELGPTDPQMIHPAPGGGVSMLPAHAYLDAHKAIVDRINTNPTAIQPADILQLQQMDPAFLQYCQQAVNASSALAEQWLARYMLAGLEQAERRKKAGEIAHQLAESREYLSHGRMINHAALRTMGLVVEYMAPGTEVWELYWELYCRSDIFLRITQQVKLFEGESASMAVKAGP